MTDEKKGEKKCCINERGNFSITLNKDETKALTPLEIACNELWKSFAAEEDEDEGFPDTLPEQDDVMLSLTKDELTALYLIMFTGPVCVAKAIGGDYGVTSLDLGKKVQDAWKAHCGTKK